MNEEQYSRMLNAAGRLITRRKQELKEEIRKSLDVANAYFTAVGMVGYGRSFGAALQHLMESGVDPICDHIMFDMYAPVRCKHIEGDDNICEDCLNPIMNRWLDRHDVLSAMATKFVIFWEDDTGVNFFTGEPRTDEVVNGV